MKTFEAEWMLRIVCAVLVGSAVGYERHIRSKEAGIRTHSIVSLGSCLLMILSQNAFPDIAKFDASRIAAQVVSGIGFLGAGVIFTQNGSTRGLTTAAGVWTTSAIGMTFGAGLYKLGFFCAVLVFVIETFFQKVFSYYPPYNVVTIIFYLNKEGDLKDINQALMSRQYHHSENEIGVTEDGRFTLTTTIRTNRNYTISEFLEEMRSIKNVVDIKVINNKN